MHSYRYRLFEKLNIKNDLGFLQLAIKYEIVGLDGNTPRINFMLLNNFIYDIQTVIYVDTEATERTQ